jgi:hypothetical protein
MRASSLAIAVALTLSPLTALAQDVWSSPAPGIRVLHRVSHGVSLRAVTADLTNPELRPAVVALDEGERDPAAAASVHDAFVGLAVPAAEGFVAEAGALLVGSSVPAGEITLGPAPVWGAVGVTATRGLVIVSGERGRVASSVAEETLRTLGVVRAVAVRGPSAPSLLLRAESLTRGAPQAQAMLAVRVLPGASAPGAREPGAREPEPVASAPRAMRVTTAVATARPTEVQAAGFSLADGGPSGVAWLVLSVLGCVSALLNRRARTAA